MIGKLGSPFSTRGTTYGASAAMLAWQYQSPGQRLIRPGYGDSQNFISRLGERDLPMNGGNIKTWPFAAPVWRRGGLISTFGQTSVFGAAKYDPMKDTTPGAQGTVFSPQWWADLNTISPGERAARKAEKQVKIDYRHGVKDDKREATQTRKQTRTDAAAAAKLERAKKSTPGSMGTALGEGIGDAAQSLANGLVPGQSGSQVVADPYGASLTTGDLSGTETTTSTMNPLYILGGVAAVGLLVFGLSQRKSKKSKKGAEKKA